MPYVNDDTRHRLARGEAPTTPGELNYAISLLCDDYIQYAGKQYSVLNAVVGALESAKLELYRRIVVSYEDVKRAENGDIYRSK